MSDSKIVSDYLRKYNAWRRGDDERTMDEAGIVPEELGRMIDAAVGALEQAPDMSRIALKKVEQMGGTPCGLLVRNEAGALAAVSDMGRVTWLDDCATQGDCKGECILPGQGARAQGDAERVLRSALNARADHFRGVTKMVQGDVQAMGNLHFDDEDRYDNALVITFADRAGLKAALDSKQCRFTVFGGEV